MSRLLRRLLAGLLALILLLALALAVLIPVTVRRSFPRVDGELRLSGLQAPVDVYRDADGIPQIYAQNVHDLFFAQGFVHAQDRFWQMDFNRHLGSGRLAEMFGEQPLGTDKFLRTLGWERVARAEIEQMDPENLAIMQAYAEGVNAYLEGRSAGSLSLEHTVLGLIASGYQAEPWEPVNSLTWAKAMAWNLGGNMDGEIQRAILLKTLSPEQLAQIIPPYPENRPVIVPEFQLPAETGRIPQASSARAYLLAAPLFADLQAQADGLDTLLGPSATSVGSNNWVIAGDRTASGQPLLANDPHLGEQIPSIWYEVGLHCEPAGPDCPYQVSGFSFAGVPGVVVGHNERIAWGVTNTGPDVEDLYLEKINPEDPNQYEFEGQWVDMDLVQETLEVNGGDPVDLTVRYTRHGPIISETYGDLEDFSAKTGIEVPENYAIALQWTALQPSFVFRAILGFDRAQNWEEFRQSARDFAVPAQNLVYADVDGNIGYQMPGWIPIRSQGDGTLPAPGWTGEYEWEGFIPFEELPYTFNPESGYVVTANNAVVGPDYPYQIADVFAYGYRADRLVSLIENAPGPITIEYIQRMQADNKNLNAENLVPLLQQLPLSEERERQALALFDGWDYQQGMDSAPAALFEVFWKHLLAATFWDDLPEGYRPDGGDRWYTVVGQLVDQPDSPWWDNRTTTAIENRQAIFSEAFAAAVEELNSSQGSNPSRWNWGDLHTLVFHNESLGDSPVGFLFNRGPFRVSGGSDLVNATRWSASETEDTYMVRTLPSMRMIVDLSNLENSLAIHTTGQSGHPYHPHYIDMADRWRNFEYHPLYWGRVQVEAAAADHLRLTP